MYYLALYALVVCALVLCREWREQSTLDRFLVADRRVGGLTGSMSIAASWIWAPAIFISTQTGFRWGLSGLLWFVVPNMLALVIFAPLAQKVRQRLPDGYSYLQCLKKGDRSFALMQLVLQLTMQVVIFAIQLVAGAELLATITGSEYRWMTVGMALTPLCYSFFSGLRTSVFTDALQYVIIASSALAILFAFPDSSITPDARPFQPLEPNLLLEFGVSSTLGLIVAIFADHQQWQRAFAITRQEISKTFYQAALLHGIVTISLGVLGCRIFAVGYTPKDGNLVGLEFIMRYYDPIFTSIFVVMAICALISTLDSALCAFSSLATQEFGRHGPSVRNGRFWMVVLVIGGIAIAFTRPDLLTLWFIASTVRLSSFVPTVMSIIGRGPPTRIYTVAVGAALVGGGSVFAAGVYGGESEIRTIGMILSLAVSGTVLAAAFLLKRISARLKIFITGSSRRSQTS